MKWLVLVFIVIVIGCIFVAAIPEGPDSISRGVSERKTLAGGGSTQQAEGGNITPLFISTERVTKRWQGYYGNISGGILLDDAAGNSLYSWGLAEPSGEIYASNYSTVTWTNIDCINFTTNTSVLKYNVSELNAFIGYGEGEQGFLDSINGTFNQTFGNDGSTFQVGSRTINNADNCSMVTLYNASGYQTDLYREVLLTDNTSIIFTALISQNKRGFNNIIADFQMIVGVNGTVDGTVRNYYFFVELS